MGHDAEMRRAMIQAASDEYYEREIDRLRALVAKGYAVVQDFMPNIGRCALQRYDLLNEFTFEAAAIGRKADQPPASMTPCAPCDATGAG